MSTANVVFKIDVVAKEFGFTLKEKQKNYKRVCLFFVKLFWLHLSFSLLITSITTEYRQEYSLCLFLIITRSFGLLLKSEQEEYQIS